MEPECSLPHSQVLCFTKYEITLKTTKRRISYSVPKATLSLRAQLWVYTCRCVELHLLINFEISFQYSDLHDITDESKISDIIIIIIIIIIN
jgi:hypothetical protein